MSSNISKIILYDSNVTIDRMQDFMGELPKNHERQLLDFIRYRDMHVTWLSFNTHLYSSVKGIPVWLSVYFVLNKLKFNHSFSILTETKEKIDAFDYSMEIKNSLKPEYITILSSGLSEIVGIKDE